MVCQDSKCSGMLLTERETLTFIAVSHSNHCEYLSLSYNMCLTAFETAQGMSLLSVQVPE